MAKISVIIPCYNAASFLDRCLTSITSQSIGVGALEIICIDDASTDATWSLLQSWEQHFPENIMIIHCDENGRQGKARNIGLQYASCPWISFIDADDWIEPDYFEKMYRAACQSNAEIVTCEHIRDFSSELTYWNNAEGGRRSEPDQFLHIDSEEKRKLFVRMMSTDLTAWGKLIQKDFLLNHEIFFPEQLAYEDNYWGPMLHFYVTKIYKVKTPLYHYYVNPASTILTPNADYHTDFLTVQQLKWNAFYERGFFEEFKQEIEFDFLHSCYLDFLKIICLRFDPPSYSMFLLLKEIILYHVPDHKSNIYLEKGFTEFQHMLLKLLALPITQAQFKEIAEHVKQIGI